MQVSPQSNRNGTFTLRFIFAEVGVFLQNGRVFLHVNHLKENCEAAASRLLYQDLTVRNGGVAIDIHWCFACNMQDDGGIVDQNNGLAVDHDELLL